MSENSDFHEISLKGVKSFLKVLESWSGNDQVNHMYMNHKSHCFSSTVLGGGVKADPF